MRGYPTRDRSIRTGRRRQPASLHPAFSLVEMLVVLGIITLVIVASVPVFRAMSGGRSLEAAGNNISAALGAARAAAIGQQKTSGVLFIVDPATGRVNAVVVQETDPPNPPAALHYAPAAGAVYLDVTDPVQSILLQSGVGLQLLDDDRIAANTATQQPLNDRYLGPNPLFFRAANAGASTFSGQINVYSESDGNHTDAGMPARCIGVILFDSQGRVVARPYRLKLGNGVPASPMTNLHRLLRNDRDFNAPITQVEARPGLGVSNSAIPGTFTTGSECKSSVGLVLFDYPTFKESPIIPGQSVRRTYTDEDPQYMGANYGIDEQTEEQWLDANGLAFYVNRYSGTLVRAE